MPPGSNRPKSSALLAAAALSALLAAGCMAPVAQRLEARRAKARRLVEENKRNEAGVIFRELAFDPRNPIEPAITDFCTSITHLASVTAFDEIDEDLFWDPDADYGGVFRLKDYAKEFVRARNNHWRAWRLAANILGRARTDRGHWDSDGRPDPAEFYCLNQARLNMPETADPDKRADLYVDMASALLGSRLDPSVSIGVRHTRHLRELTVLSTQLLEEAESEYDHDRYAYLPPLAENGDPIFYRVPTSFDAAKNNGERWRWLLDQAMKLAPEREQELLMLYANFLRNRFGVHTARYAAYRAPMADEYQALYRRHQDECYSLKDTEALALLKAEHKRFSLPDDANYIRIYEKIAGMATNTLGELALLKLAKVFEIRKQYERSASYWERSIKQYGDPGGNKKTRIAELLGPAGRFESSPAFLAGKPVLLDFESRNVASIALEARKVRLADLMSDTRRAILSLPRETCLERIRGLRTSIACFLVEDEGKQYLDEPVAAWTQELDMDRRHLRHKSVVRLPFHDAGLYLVTATMPGESRSIAPVWLTDTVILSRKKHNEVCYVVADAATGRPIPKATLKFCTPWERTHWYSEGATNWLPPKVFATVTDANGVATIPKEKLDEERSWLVTAEGPGGRFAVDGLAYRTYSDWDEFGEDWGFMSDESEADRQVFTVTDRPVYRPGDEVNFKMWIRKPGYEEVPASHYANREYTVKVVDPHGAPVFRQEFSTDALGGFHGKLKLSSDAGLGEYRIRVHDSAEEKEDAGRFFRHWGYHGSFSVEAYKKPEFEVTIESPLEVLTVGDKVRVVVSAKYYFGAPVKGAEVKYAVRRQATSLWGAPNDEWDWLYGIAYWSFPKPYDWCPSVTTHGRLNPRAMPYLYDYYPRSGAWTNGTAVTDTNGTVVIEFDTDVADEDQAPLDYEYTVRAIVRDSSRREIRAQDTVLVFRHPLLLCAWVDRGHYSVGDTVRAQFRAEDSYFSPLATNGTVRVFQVTHDKGDPREKLVHEWTVATDTNGLATREIPAAEPGQYRLSYSVRDSRGRESEQGYLFQVHGERSDTNRFRFNPLELVPDKAHYSPGETVRLLLRTDAPDSTVILFPRPRQTNQQARVIRMKGRTHVEEITVLDGDVPDFHVEGVTLRDLQMHSDSARIAVPPLSRIVNVDIKPDAEFYGVGKKARLQLRLTDHKGEPFKGSAALSVYDSSVEYFTGASPRRDIHHAFWAPEDYMPRRVMTSIWPRSYDVTAEGGYLVALGRVGRFGVLETDADLQTMVLSSAAITNATWSLGARCAPDSCDIDEFGFVAAGGGGGGGGGAFMARRPGVPRPDTRRDFRDTALWVPDLRPDSKGMARAEFVTPDSLTDWTIRCWAMGHGTAVGQAATDVHTFKDVLLRAQTPRFCVESDEVVLSANIHNFLENSVNVDVSLELSGAAFKHMDNTRRRITIAQGRDRRIDWRVKALASGEATVLMKALAAKESDAVEVRFPVLVHGAPRTESAHGIVAEGDKSHTVTVTVPRKRRPELTKLEIVYAPSLARAMVDAIPYLLDYPYGCAEQTLNRFIPAVVTLDTLKKMGVRLEDLDKTARSSADARPDRYREKPVFSTEVVSNTVKRGLIRLNALRNRDGGWTWFAGEDDSFGLSWSPYMTAYVVHGLRLAERAGVAVPEKYLSEALELLEERQKKRVKTLLKKRKPDDETAREEDKRVDNVDALIFTVLTESGVRNEAMLQLLYKGRMHLSLYGKALLGLACHELGEQDRLVTIVKGLRKHLVQDAGNHVAYLRLPHADDRWLWYGDDVETQACYLRLLTRMDPGSAEAGAVARYLVHNRRNAWYWKSTRDTAACIEALSEYLLASGEATPDMEIEVLVDGKPRGKTNINRQNLLTFNSRIALGGAELDSGKHRVTVRRKGKGTVYFSALLSNFVLDDPIRAAATEIAVTRRYHRLTYLETPRHQPLLLPDRVYIDGDVYAREELESPVELKSGDLLQVELAVNSGRDLEYIVVEDMKPAGCETIDVTSGYISSWNAVYRELRDDRVVFLMHSLSKGEQMFTYRLRAEIPGRFSALPVQCYGMYSPDLRANSDEHKFVIAD